MSGETDNETWSLIEQRNKLLSELDHLRQDNERLRGEVEKAKQERNAEGVRQRNIYLPQLQRHKSCLEVASGKLKECSDRLAACQHYPDTASSYETKACIEASRVTLHQINEVLGGDSTKTT